MNNVLNTQVSIKDIMSLFAQKNDIKDIALSEAYRLFLTDRKVRNREGTVKFYQEHLDLVIKVLNSKGIYKVSQLNRQVLNDLVCFFKGKKNKPTTINRRIKALKTLVLFLEENELITPMNLKFKYLSETLPKIETVDMEDMKRVLKYIETLSISSQAMILLLFTTGIRNSELINIEAANVDFKHLTIYLTHTKNGEARYTPIVEPVAEVLKKLISQNNNSKWLFPKKDCITSHVSVEASRSLLARTKKALNIEVLSAHKLRHLFATTLLRQGTDIKTVSKLLGHKSIRITERYLDLTDTEIMQKGRTNNPLNLTDYGS